MKKEKGEKEKRKKEKRKKRKIGKTLKRCSRVGKPSFKPSSACSFNELVELDLLSFGVDGATLLFKLKNISRVKL